MVTVMQEKPTGLKGFESWQLLFIQNTFVSVRLSYPTNQDSNQPNFKQTKLSGWTFLSYKKKNKSSCHFSNPEKPTWIIENLHRNALNISRCANPKQLLLMWQRVQMKLPLIHFHWMGVFVSNYINTYIYHNLSQLNSPNLQEGNIVDLS